MRIVIDTNVLFSIFLFPSPKMQSLVDTIVDHHIIVLPTYVLDELKNVVKKKFPQKHDLLERFIHDLPFSLAHTPEIIDKEKFPEIRDEKDLPVLVTALLEDVDILITGDADFTAIDINRPEILTPAKFLEKYAPD